MAPQPPPIDTHRVKVPAGWIDYNGHMNEGYYAVAFGDATDSYLSQRGFDASYREYHRGTFYTVETHIRYLSEVQLGDPLLMRTTVLGVDARKLHIFHSMVHETAGFEAATQEAFLLHVRVDVDRVTTSPMAADVLAAIRADRDAHAGAHPAAVGRGISPLQAPA